MKKLVKAKTGTKIEWAEKSWNPVVGCHQISDGCKNCYAKSMHKRHFANPKQPNYTQPFNKVVELEHELKKPLEWKTPQIVFVCSMSDLFNKDVSDEFIHKVFKVMNKSHHHYRVLTKRSERLRKLAPTLNWTPNIWAGVTVESSKHISRIDDLRVVPSEVRFLSLEPLIEDLGDIDLTNINWVIAGGESGNSLKSLRKVELDWVVSIRDKCLEKEIPFFFKQWGRVEFNPDQNDPTIPVKGVKTDEHQPKGGHLVEGEEYSQTPEFSIYWGVEKDADIQEEFKSLEIILIQSIKDFTNSWISIGKTLFQIKGKIDKLGGGSGYWRTYLDADSFKDYCETRLKISKETGIQMRQAYKIIESIKPELLLDETNNIPPYTKLRSLGPHIDKLVENPDKYSEIIDATFEDNTSRSKLNKLVNQTFTKPINLSNKTTQTNDFEVFDWEEYVNDFEEKINFELDLFHQERLKELMSEVRELLNLK